MTTGSDDNNRLDRVGAVVAIGAAVHCLLAGVLERLLPVLAGEGAHLVFALIAVSVSVPAVMRGWMLHHEFRVFSWAVPGWLALGLARFGGERQFGEGTEIFLTVVAAVLLFVAHQLNRSLAYWHNKP
jgi:hypothetical protein